MGFFGSVKKVLVFEVQLLTVFFNIFVCHLIESNGIVQFFLKSLTKSSEFHSVPPIEGDIYMVFPPATKSLKEEEFRKKTDKFYMSNCVNFSGALTFQKYSSVLRSELRSERSGATEANQSTELQFFLPLDFPFVVTVISLHNSS